MSFTPKIELGQKVSNEEISKLFKCGNQGGMRRSKKLNCLVLISDHTKRFYEDLWQGKVLHYTGMGKKGHQSLDSLQNKTLNFSERNGIAVFLFEVFRRGEYVFRGRVGLAAEPYQKVQPDFEGNVRTVWIFPLKSLEGESPAVVTERVFEQLQEAKERHSANLSDEELRKRAAVAGGEAKVQTILSSRHARNPNVAELAKRRAAGKCQLCDENAPFKDQTGRPYLEVHHVKWLSRDERDVIENTVALCPNCHRKVHVLDLSEDKARMQLKAQRPRDTD